MKCWISRWGIGLLDQEASPTLLFDHWNHSHFPNSVSSTPSHYDTNIAQKAELVFGTQEWKGCRQLRWSYERAAVYIWYNEVVLQIQIKIMQWARLKCTRRWDAEGRMMKNVLVMLVVEVRRCELSDDDGWSQ